VARSKGFADVEKFLDQWQDTQFVNRQETVDGILDFHKKMKQKYGIMPDSAEILREDRMRG
jgi:hypothetical protein